METINRDKIFEGISHEAKTLSTTDVLNEVFIWAGIICVLIIVVAGLTYVISAGNSSMVARAKNTMIYALVGLVIIILAFGIVNFIIGALG
ncbi:MAG: hypothetical protein Q4A27_01490 [bacterium]|nr:hypothetical protein [bacterium]